MKCWRLRFFALIALSAGLLPLAERGVAQEPLGTYRRIFVPKDEVDRQVRGLLPLKRDEFERRLRLASRASNNGEQPQVVLQRAEYSARLEGNHLVDGRAQLQVIAKQSEGGWLPLEPSNLAIRNPTWQGNPDRPAIVGLRAGGGLMCRIVESGVLQYDWTRRGEIKENGDIVIELSLPAAPLSTLSLQIPPDATLTSDFGIVSLRKPGAEEARTGAAESPSAPDTFKTWDLDLGGAQQATLRISRDSELPQDDTLVLARETSSYSLQPSTVDLDATFDVDVLRQPVDELRLVVDSPLALTSLRLGERELEWRVASSDESMTEVTASLAEPLSGIGQKLRVAATAILSGSTPWRLPRIRLSGAAWQEGTTKVSAAPSIQAVLRPIGSCRQTAFTSASAAQTSEVYDFQCFAPDAEIEVSLPARRTALSELSGAHLEISPGQVHATYVCELSSLGGQIFAVEGLLARQWVVDSIDVLPAESVEDRVLAPRGRGVQALRIALRRPIQPGKPLRVVINAHRPRPAPGESLSADNFRIVNLQEVEQSRRLVSVHVADPASQLRLKGDENLTRLAADDLSAQEQRLFESPLGTLLFAMDHGADALDAELTAGAPRYRADVITTATVKEGYIAEECRIACVPEGSTISKLAIRFSPPPTGPLSWQLVNEDPRAFVVSQIEDQAAQTSGNEAVYSLELARPRSAPFEISVRSSHRLDLPTRLSLVTLPTAATQKAEVRIFSTDGNALAIAAEEMQSLPPPDEGSDPSSTLLGRFRYEAGRRPSIRISPHKPADGQSVVWADSLTVESKFSADGSADHEAVFQVNNAGAGTFIFRLPLSAGVVRAAIDGEAEAGKPKRLSSGEYALNLPPGRRRAMVRLQYFSEPAADIRLPWREFSAPLPQVEIPIHSRQWRVLLAPCWKLADHSPMGPLFPAQSERAPVNDFSNWNAYELPLPQSSESALTVYSPSIVTSWSWCLAIASAAIVMRILTKGPAWTLLVLGSLVAAAILAPPPYSILLAGAAVGVAGGAMALLLRPLARRSTLSELGNPHSSTVMLSRREVTAVTLGIALFLGQWALGSVHPLAAQEKISQASQPQVVIPIDDGQQPAGDYVFVSPSFYDSLMRLSDPGADSSVQWVLTNAIYQLPAAPPGGASQPSIDGIGIQFEIETFRPGVVVPLPLRRSQVHLAEGSARLDGGPASVAWADDGLSLQLPIEMQGKHRFEMLIGAAAKESAEGILLDIHIPPIATSVVTWTETTTSSPAIISAIGAERIESDGGQRHCDLGPAARLVVQWPGGDGPLEPAIVEAEQLVVWRVRPGSVIAEAKFRVRPLGGKLRQVQIRTDPRLRLLPPTPEQGIARHRVDEGSSNLVHLELAEPVVTEAVLNLSFLWAASSGAGNLVPPEIEVVVDRISRHWTAVMLDELLEWEPAPPRIADAPLAEAFATAWGAPLDAAAVSIFEGAAPQLTVRPAQTQIEAHQSIDYSVSRRNLSIRYAAELSGLSPHAFLHRLTIAPRVRVTKVAVLEDRVPALNRWSHQGSNILSIALSDEPGSKQRLEVEAEMEFGGDQSRLTLPLIRLSELKGSSMAIRVFRHSDVQIKMQSSPKWTKHAEPPGQFSEGLGRLVAAIGTDAADGIAPPTIVLSPNEPRTTGSLVTRVFGDEGGWQADIVCDLRVTGGVLDGLRLSIPDQWTGPFEITPAVEHRTLQLPGQSLRHLHIRPQQAVSGQLTLTIRTPLRSAAGELVAAPNVTLLDAPEVERIIVLQTEDSGSPIQWQTSGLQAAGNERPGVSSQRLAGFETYRVVAPYFVAVAHRQERAAGSPHVRLADVVAHCYPNRCVSTETMIDLDPAGRKFVLLEVPPGNQLVNVSIEGIPAQLVRTAPRTWQVRLVDELLPQRLAIVCGGSLPSSSASSAAWEIAAPRIVGATPSQMLWSVSGLEQAHPEAENNAISELDAANHFVLRAESLAQTISKFKDDSRTDGHAGGFLDLWPVWLERYEEAEAAAVKNLARSKNRPLLDRIAAVNVLVDAASEDLKESGRLPLAVDIVPPPPAADSVLRPAADHYFRSAGAIGSITLIAPVKAPSGQGERWNWAAAAICLGLVSYGAVKSPAITAWITEHTHLLVGLAGCGWLVLGTPAWPGWLALALAVWLALQSPWSSSRSESESTLLRRP